MSLSLSNGEVIDYRVGDKPFSSICDYMESCNYQCKPPKTESLKEKQPLTREYFIKKSSIEIIKRIKDLMKEEYFYEKV